MNAPTSAGSMKLSRHEAEELALRVADLASARLPLAAGLDAASAEVGSRRLALGLRELAQGIRAGQSLEGALQQLADRIPPPLVALFSAAEKSGHLGLVLEEWTQHKMAARLRWRRLSAALAYPTACVVIALGILTMLAWYVVPQFRTMIDDLQTVIPVQTVALFALADYFPAGVACVAGVLIAMAMLIRVLGGAGGWYWLVARMPMLGKVWHWSSVAEGLRIAGLLVEHRMGLPQALRLAGEGLRDVYVGDAFRSLARHSEAGMPLWSGMLKDRRLPLSLTPLLRVGEQDGQMAASLRGGAEMLERRIQQRCDLIAAIVPPMLFMALAAVILAVFSALFLPMITLINALSR